jgi:hypothetical protein
MLLNKAVLSLAKLAPKEHSRYTLCGICVERECATVTNGHYLVSVSGPRALDSDYPQTTGLTHKVLAEDPMAETVLLSRDGALAALKALPKRTTLPTLQNAAVGEDRKLYVNTLDNVSAFDHRLEGQFPNWRQLMPNGEPTAEIELDAYYLKALAEYMIEHAKQSSAKQAPVRLTIYGADRAMRFDAAMEDGGAILAVLMPLRMGASHYAKRPDQQKAKADAKLAKVAE